MGRHRQDEDVSRTDPTQILPVVKPRRVHASPLLLGAGAVALTLVLGVGGWALVGSRSGGDPLVFPWSGDKPGDIDVSVSMVPTDEPTPSPVRETLSASPARPRPQVPKDPSPTVQVSLSTLASAQPSPSRSAESLATTLSASVASVTGWSGNLLVSVDVRNPGASSITAWTIELWTDQDVNVYQQWNAKDQQVDARHLKFVQDRTLNANETIRIGFIAAYSGQDRPRLQKCTLNGREFTCRAG